MKRPSNIETARVNAAVRSLCAHLDRFETICAKNNSPLLDVVYRNTPNKEFSGFRVRYRKTK
jgi:hypothetical protein